MAPKIASSVDTSSEIYKKRYAYNKGRVEEISKIRAKIAEGGSQRAKEIHKKRGKLLARERIEFVLDEGSPFLEIAPFAAYDIYENKAPSAGIIAGIGKISGHLVMIVANDATVKGGTYLPLTIKKHIRAQKIALENRLPCLYIVDSGGVFLPLQEDVFPDKEHFGNIFYNQAQLSKKGLLQVAVVAGFSTAGGAYVPAMCDQTVIVKGTGAIFIGGPPLVKAATGEDVTVEELGGADVHTKISGVADYMAENDEDALLKAREIFSTLPKDNPYQLDRIKPAEPDYDVDEIYGIIPTDLKKPFDSREIIARIVDASEFDEFKPEYGRTLVTGFARIGGYLVGILANNGVIFPDSADKGAHFVELCGYRKIPILFLQNITGFMIGKAYEHAGIARAGAKMINAVATTNVPKFTVIIGNSYGAGNYAMCGRGYNPRFLWIWPNAKIAVMGGEQAADTLAQVKINQLKRAGKELSAEEINALRQPILDDYEKQSSPLYASARLWDDGIIDPAKTREYLMLAIEIASRNIDQSKQRYGIFRM